MKKDTLVKYLENNEFHLDPLGRIVIDDPEILKAINGALGSLGNFDEALINAGCNNTGC